jgi:hypothetical protein
MQTINRGILQKKTRLAVPASYFRFLIRKILLKAACRLILRDYVTSIELAKISMVQDRTWLGHQTLAIEKILFVPLISYIQWLS